MAKSVFYSFHYDPDYWRVWQVRQINALTTEEPMNAQAWETVKRRGDTAVKNWIAEQMKYKSAVVVLVGEKTATRPWVDYEIRYAWDNHKPLIGIRIHGLKDRFGNTSQLGSDPFKKVKLTNGETLDQHVWLINPSGGTSKEIYGSIESNLESWVASHAVTR